VADFSIYAGDTTVLRITVKDEAGAAVDLGSSTIRWQLAVNVYGTPLLAKSVGSGVEVVDAANGRFDVTLDSEDTEVLSGGTYYHEAEMYDGGVVSTILTGTIQINPSLIH
jgi:hypothetical protein